MSVNGPQVMKPPSSGRGKSRALTRGFHPSASDRAVIGEILRDRPVRRDLLIEFLHLIQDREGCLRYGRLAALAEHLRLAMAEVYEVATFYHNFRVLPDEAPAPPKLQIKICDSLPCQLAGADALLASLRDRWPGQIEVRHAACLGRCDRAPVAAIGHRYVEQANEAKLAAEVEAPRDMTAEPGVSVGEYRAQGGYALLHACLGGLREPDEIIEHLERSGLRGLGGAGFPTGRKWRLVRTAAAPRLMAVNADESEPGTFKDRYYLLRSPHAFLEGMFIAAWAVGAERIYIFLRDEYPDVRALLERALSQAKEIFPALPEVEIRRGAGAYICGEESAMLESIEGKRGLPRHKPPFPSEVGLFGRPTLINNVETLYWVPAILLGEPSAFRAEGRRGCSGLRSFSVSGRVREPGVKLAPAGISAQELIDEYCGGMLPGHRFTAYLPGGASGGILPARLGDLPLDFGTLEAHGSFIGSAAVIVLSDQDDLRAAALNLMRFFRTESCGQCTPCRLGTEKAEHLMAAGSWDEAALRDLASVMIDASICGLGQAAPNGLLSLLRHFPEAVGR